MTQTEKLFELLKSGRPVRTDEILLKVYGSSHNGIARIGARIADLKAGKWPGKQKCTITGYHDPDNVALYFYRMDIPNAPKLPPAFEPQAAARQSLFD
jgi:hypothetical protein